MSTGIRNIKSVLPLLDRVLVRRAKAQTQTASGLFIPEKNVEKLNLADVISTGPGLTDKDGKVVPTSVKAGDKVLIPQYGGSSIKVGEDDYILFRDSDILAKLQNE